MTTSSKGNHNNHNINLGSNPNSKQEVLCTRWVQ